MIEIRWHGRGGQGAFTAAKMLGGAVLTEKKYALSFPSFGPERRGAPIQAFTKIDEKPVINRSEVNQCDYMVFLDESLFNIAMLSDLKENGKIILNSPSPDKYADFPRVFVIDGNKIAMEELNEPIANTAMLGALIGTTGLIKQENLLSIIADYLPSKIAAKNTRIIQRAYALGREGAK